MVTLVNWDWFRKHDASTGNGTGSGAVVRARNDDEYEELKAALTNKLWEQVTRHFPKLADKVDYMEGEVFNVGKG